MNDETKTYNLTVDFPAETPVNVMPPYPQRHLKGMSYLRMYSESYIAMAKDKRLTDESRRVLLAILGSIQYENCFTMPVSKLAEKIDMKQPNAAKAVKKLVMLGYLHPIEKKNRIVTYMLNPNFAFKTKAYKLHGLKELWTQITDFAASSIYSA